MKTRLPKKPNEDDLASTQDTSLLSAATFSLRSGGKDPFLLGMGADSRSPWRAGTDKQSS